MKVKKIVSILIIFSLVLSMVTLPKAYAAETADYKVDLSNLTYSVGGTEEELTKYTQDDFDKFLSDYNSGNLPELYVTEFLFDGVSMVKTYDLDDFVEEGNDTEVETLDITAINVNTTGSVEFTGEITGGMIAVDTNGRSGEVNLILNNVKIDTDSKKTPAIYVYNKDITYTGCKVTIKTATGSKNYIEGGKFKKVSLIGSDELSNYSSKYSGDSSNWYSSYTNYYGVYTSEQIKNILFAKVQADNEDLADGDPYYFYKGAGAISSDIDLYFEGTGYLEVISKNKEGIETKGNLTFSGGTGDYVVKAEDDCLNTTTTSSSSKSARNSLTIDVNSLYAIVDAGEDSDEGDAIDSNGTLVINGGTIVAIAHPGQDAGLDSVSGTYINAGTVLATGDMYDAISSESKQNYIVLSFANKVETDSLITLVNENDEAIMSYKTDRTFTNLIYSSADLTDGTYNLYKGGSVDGSENSGFYTEINNYTKGTMQAYSTEGMQGRMGGMNGGMQRGNMQQREMNEEFKNEKIQNGNVQNGNNMGKRQMGEKSFEDSANNRMKNGEKMENSSDNMNDDNRPQIPNDDMENTNISEMPEIDFENGERPEMPSGEMPNGMQENMNNENNNTSATNTEFVVSGISNQFSGITDYGESTTQTSESTNNSDSKESSLNSVTEFIKNNAVVVGISAVAVIVVIGIIVVVLKKERKH